MPATKKEQIYALAEPQHGFFTSARAKADGLLQNTLTAMARRGVIERVSRGVYRLANFPLSQLSQYMEAVLWPQQGVKGVISHQSALAFHGLSDVSPAEVLDGIPVTTPRSAGHLTQLVLAYARRYGRSEKRIRTFPTADPRLWKGQSC